MKQAYHSLLAIITIIATCWIPDIVDALASPGGVGVGLQHVGELRGTPHGRKPVHPELWRRHGTGQLRSL